MEEGREQGSTGAREHGSKEPRFNRNPAVIPEEGHLGRMVFVNLSQNQTNRHFCLVSTHQS